jgi:hypothetical protein
MKKILILMLVCLVVGSVSVMAACEKYEADIVNGELTGASAYADGSKDTDYFGFTDSDNNGVYNPEYENYDTCVLPNHPYLEEYYCDGENAHFETVECEFGCETVELGQVPFGRCAEDPNAEELPEVDTNSGVPDSSAESIEEPGVTDEGKPDRVNTGEPELIREAIELEECTSKDEIHTAKEEIRAEFFEYVKARKLVSMETGINYYNDMGIDTTELVTYMEETEDVSDWQDLKDVVSQFKTVAHEINYNNDIVDETLDELIELLRDARNNDAELVAMHDEIEELALQHRLMIFDTRVCIANNAITKLSYHGEDATDVKADLEAIEDLRDDFKDSIEIAQDACYRGIGICVAEEAEDYKELKEEIDGMFKDLRLKITAML